MHPAKDSLGRNRKKLLARLERDTSLAEEIGMECLYEHSARILRDAWPKHHEPREAGGDRGEGLRGQGKGG